MSDPIAPLYPILYEGLVRRALEEDLGRAGDLTSDACLPPGLQGEAKVVVRRAGRIAGWTPRSPPSASSIPPPRPWPTAATARTPKAAP